MLEVRYSCYRLYFMLRVYQYYILQFNNTYNFQLNNIHIRDFIILEIDTLDKYEIEFSTSRTLTPGKNSILNIAKKRLFIGRLKTVCTKINTIAQLVGGTLANGRLLFLGLSVAPCLSATHKLLLLGIICFWGFPFLFLLIC